MPITGSASTIWNDKRCSGAGNLFSSELGKQARKPGSQLPGQPGQAYPESGLTERQRKAINCLACRTPITGEQHRIEMAGRHGHRVTNPHGTEFMIGCFNQANGCLAAGHPYRLHSWFGGYQWQIALCRHCGTHLGWYFSQTGASPFYALIFNRITD